MQVVLLLWSQVLSPFCSGAQNGSQGREPCSEAPCKTSCFASPLATLLTKGMDFITLSIIVLETGKRNTWKSKVHRTQANTEGRKSAACSLPSDLLTVNLSHLFSVPLATYKHCKASNMRHNPGVLLGEVHKKEERGEIVHRSPSKPMQSIMSCLCHVLHFSLTLTCGSR